MRNRSVQVGQIIKELRRSNALNGVDLAYKAGISQSKLSKIETGHYPKVDTQLIQHILNILDTSKTIRQRIAVILDQADSRRETLHATYYNNLSNHVLVTKWESAVVHMRNVTINCIPALLQTMPYRMAVLTQWLGASDLQPAMRETIKRQDYILTAGVKTHFILHQAALYTLITQKSEHIAQLDRLDRLLGMPNMLIGIVPVEAGLPINEHSNFAILGDDKVIEVMTGREAEVIDPDIKADYLQTFEELDSRAVYGNEARQLIHKAVDYFM